MVGVLPDELQTILTFFQVTSKLPPRGLLDMLESLVLVIGGWGEDAGAKRMTPCRECQLTPEPDTCRA